MRDLMIRINKQRFVDPIVGFHAMTHSAEKKPAICCPQCGSAKVRRKIFRRLNIGCLFVNALGFVTMLERPGLCVRICRECGNEFVK